MLTRCRDCDGGCRLLFVRRELSGWRGVAKAVIRKRPTTGRSNATSKLPKPSRSRSPLLIRSNPLIPTLSASRHPKALGLLVPKSRLISYWTVTLNLSRHPLEPKHHRPHSREGLGLCHFPIGGGGTTNAADHGPALAASQFRGSDPDARNISTYKTLRKRVSARKASASRSVFSFASSRLNASTRRRLHRNIRRKV